MLTSASKGARVAAGIVCAVFAAFVLIHLLWAVGITWGLNSELAGVGDTEAGIALTAVSLAAAAAGTAAIIVTLARVGWLKTPLSDRMLHIGNWVVFVWPALGTLNPVSTWAQRAVTLPLAIAALVVARAHPTAARRRRAAVSGRARADRRDRMTKAPEMSLLNRIGATRPGTWAIAHVVSPLQRRLLVATRGRVSLTGKRPVLLLTATGRRSGRPRTIPLFFLRDGEDLVVCNVRPPSERPNPWPLNVRANPNVSVLIGGVTEQRVAREARGQEVEKYWPLLLDTWPAYGRFYADTHERSIFVLQRQ